MSTTALVLEKLLRARIDLVHVQHRAFAPGSAIPDTIVPSTRLLLACGGNARYVIEGSPFTFDNGSMLLIFPRTRRSWTVRGRSRFSLWWAEFESPAALSGATHFLSRECNVKLERAALQRLARLCGMGNPRAALEAEGEFKAILARFLARADTPALTHSGKRSAAERAVVDASEWLSVHFQEPAALALLQQRIELSPNHFRLIFRRHFGCSAQHYLTALRMRSARALLRETVKPVKEIAHAVGIRDPLFFSRTYTAYWKRSPSRDREFSP